MSIIKIAIVILLVVLCVTVGYFLRDTLTGSQDITVLPKNNVNPNQITSRPTAKERLSAKAVVTAGDSSTSTLSVVNEQAVGIIKSAYTKNGKNYIDIDYISLKQQAGNIPQGVMVNENPKIRTFEVSSTARIYIQNQYVDGQLSTVDGDLRYRDFSDLTRIFTENRQSDFRISNPWNIIVLNGKVVQIEENFRS